MQYLCETHEFLLVCGCRTPTATSRFTRGCILPTTKRPNSLLYRAYGEVLTAQNHYHAGTDNQTVRYLTNGNAADWMYGEQTTKNKIIAFIPEVGSYEDGFWPSADRIIPLCKENVWCNTHVLRLTHPYATVSVKPDLYVGELTTSLPFTLQRLGLSDTGTYTVYLEPLLGVSSVGEPESFTGLDLLETANGAFSYTLNPSIAVGDLITFNVVVANGTGLLVRQLVTQQVRQLNHHLHQSH